MCVCVRQAGPHHGTSFERREQERSMHRAIVHAARHVIPPKTENITHTHTMINSENLPYSGAGKRKKSVTIKTTPT